MTRTQIILRSQSDDFYQGVKAMYGFLREPGNGMRTAGEMIDEIENAKSEDDE